MKKILALMIALVLIFSISTVAFAKTTQTQKQGYSIQSVSKYYVRPIDDNTTKTDLTIYASAGWQKVIIDGDSTTTWLPEYFSDGVDFYYSCDASVADYRVFNTSGMVTYAVKATEIVDYVSEGTFVKASTKNTCMGYIADTIEVDGDPYDVSDSFVGYWVYVNGKLFAISDLSSGVYAHKFELANVTFKGVTSKDNVTPVSVKCSNCSKTFEIVDSLGKYEGKYAVCCADNAYASFNFVSSDMVGYYVLLGDCKVAAAETEKVDGVNSAKTFDAGIAMYVGMSLSAVAGSAVVIGKKKEI